MKPLACTRRQNDRSAIPRCANRRARLRRIESIALRMRPGRVGAHRRCDRRTRRGCRGVWNLGRDALVPWRAVGWGGRHAVGLLRPRRQVNRCGLPQLHGRMPPDDNRQMAQCSLLRVEGTAQDLEAAQRRRREVMCLVLHPPLCRRDLRSSGKNGGSCPHGHFFDMPLETRKLVKNLLGNRQQARLHVMVGALELSLREHGLSALTQPNEAGYPHLPRRPSKDEAAPHCKAFTTLRQSFRCRIRPKPWGGRENWVWSFGNAGEPMQPTWLIGGLSGARRLVVLAEQYDGSHSATHDDGANRQCRAIHTRLP